MAFLQLLWNGFKAFAHVVQTIMSGILFTVLYLVVVPFWSVMRFSDPLRTRWTASGGKPSDSYWEPYANRPQTLDRYQRPF